MQIDTIRIASRMRATGGALAAGRDVWRDSGGVKTQVWVAQSDYAIEVRDTHFHCRSSAPLGRAASRIAGRSMFGETWQGVHHGYGVWSVVRGASEIHRRVGVLDFQWLMEDADKVMVQFTDRDGNVGGWATHTASVTGTIDRHQYVDTAGSDAADGLTPGTAVATAYQARLNMEAAILANEVGAIHYRRGQVHTYTSSTLPWQGHVAGIRRRCIFDGYDVGADPIIRGDGSSSPAFTYGNLDSIELHGLRLEGERIADVESVGVSCLRTAGTRGPQNLLIRDCTLTDHRTCIILQDSHMTQAQRLTGGGDFVCLWRTSLTEAGAFHLFDSVGSRYVSVTDCTFTKTYGESGVNTTRVSNWLHYVMHNTTWSPENGGSMRLQCGRDTTVGKDIGESGYGSISDCTFVGTDRQYSAWGFGRPAPDDSSEGWLHDVRMVNLRIQECRFALGVGTFGQTAGGNQIDRAQLWGCTIGGSIDLMGGPASGRLNSFEAIDCATVQSATSTSQAFRLDGREADRYAAGSVKIRGHIAIWPSGSAGFQRQFVQAHRLTQSQFLSIVDSNWNHAAHAGTGAPGWIDGGLYVPPEFTQTWDLSLAQFQAATGNDLDSTSRQSSTLGIVTIGTAGQADTDVRYAAAGGVVDNLGWPRAHALDASRKIRFSPPDPGPFEFGATLEPDGPPGVSGPGLIATASGFLSLSGSATATVIVEAQSFGGLSLGGSSSAISAASATAEGHLALLGASSDGLTIGGIDPPGSGSANATSIGRIGLSGSASVGSAVAAQAAAAFRITGQSVADVAPTVPGHGVKITNTSASAFTGWVPINTDLLVTEPYGQRSGVTFVRGEATGVDTMRVDLFVTLAAGASLALADLVAESTNAPPAPTEPVDFTGGDLALGGVAMTKWGAEIVDGRGLVQEWRIRTGVWMVIAWTRRNPGEPWGTGEVAVTYSDFTVPDATATWTDQLLTWGNGTTTVLGRAGSSGSFLASGTQFGRAQDRMVPFMVHWTGRYRDGADASNVAAMQEWGITGHGIQSIHPDGPFHQTPTALTWAAANKAAATARLHTWDVSPNNITKNSKDSGPQQDQAWTRSEPMFDTAATHVTYLEAMQWAKRPCHYLRANGDHVSAATHPNLRIFDGIPNGNGTDNLGAPFNTIAPDNINVTTNGWFGPDLEHWLVGGLALSVRYRATPGQQWLLRNHGTLYLLTKFPDVPTWGANAAVQSTRDLIWEPILVVHLWRELQDRAMATAVRDRFFFRCGAGGPILPWISTGPYGDIWDVRNSFSESIPVFPGWIPWQQGPACWALDFAVRYFSPSLDSLIPWIAAGAARTVNDVWRFEYDPSFGVERWVEYERLSISGVRSRGGGFDLQWFPPLIHYLLRYSPNDSRAVGIWQQMLDRSAATNDTRRWFPPILSAAPVEGPSTALGRLPLGGSSSATGAGGGDNAIAFGLLSLAGASMVGSAVNGTVFGWIALDGTAIGIAAPPPPLDPINPGQGGPIVFPPRPPRFGRRPWAGGQRRHGQGPRPWANRRGWW